MRAVILVSHDLEYRRRLSDLLKAELGLLHYIEAESLSEACQHPSADLLLIDLTVPDATDELLWGGLRFCHPAAQIVALFTEYDEPLKLAFVAGAMGFIPKDLEDENLVERLNDVMQGIHVVVDDSFFERLQTLQAEARHKFLNSDSTTSALEHLTPREQEILSLLSQGAGDKEIATRLHLSERTVRNSVSRILNKLGLRNRTQAALWAWRHRLGREGKL
jgi:DNA-binding NarL/FixJ family response regulator